MREILWIIIIITILIIVCTTSTPTKEYVWIDGCQYIKIQEEIIGYRNINYIKTGNCK